ncbi:SDR family oxidoreductase [uncultured Chryseobacterium sp.]|uniref:SDR family oxidoreductase n=1 Tax=uncultured Chryseobacterium sp. TaxID=259322 RepID=UPI00338FB8FE
MKLFSSHTLLPESGEAFFIGSSKKASAEIGQPGDIANACIFLLSDASKWVTGTNLVIDGGYSEQ